ncbi:putative methyltransferase-like protein, partial [Leptotrombidium deliense]
VARSENLPLEDESVDLITACQCFHWFDFEAFFKEARRILKENGVLAVTGYSIPTIHIDQQCTENASLNSNILFDIYSTTLKPYFEMNRLYYLDSHYKDIEFPFNDVLRTNMTAKKEITAKDCIDYVKSWSGFESCFQKDRSTAEKVITHVENTFMAISNETDLSKIPLVMQTDNILILSRK